MNDDIAVPRALAEIHTTVRAGNKALAEGDDARALERREVEPESQALVLEVLGALHPSRSLVWTLGRRPALPGGVDAVAVRGYGLVIVVFVLGGESAGGVGVGGGVGAGHCSGVVASPAMPDTLMLRW